MDQEHASGGILSFVFGLRFLLLKVSGQLAKQYLAAGAVRSLTGRRLGYCFMIGPAPNSSLVGHVIGTFLHLHVELFLPSIFNFVNF